MLDGGGSGGGAGPSNGTGSSWMSGVWDAVQDAATDVYTELSSFQTFKKRIDQLITDLKGSDAGPGKVGQDQLVRAQFGGGNGEWAEAAGLFTAYETVITELENLSKLLSDSMEGVGIAVMASHKGYENIDLDIRDRMVAIGSETTEHYGGAYEPKLPGGSGDTGQVRQTDKPGSGPEQSPSDGEAGGTI